MVWMRLPRRSSCLVGGAGSPGFAAGNAELAEELENACHDSWQAQAHLHRSILHGEQLHPKTCLSSPPASPYQSRCAGYEWHT